MSDTLMESNGVHTSVSAARRSRRVVVTGAAGFIGGHLAARLIADGATVIGLDRRDPHRDTAAAENLADVLAEPTFSYRRLDVAEQRWEEVMHDADVVLHLAAQPGVRPSWGPRFDDYVTSNVVATQRVVDAAIRIGVPRLVIASSSSVYGRTDGRPSSETTPTVPMSPYGVTKLAAESLALAHAQRNDSVTSVAALRYFTVYGPRQRPDMLIGRVLTATLGGPPLQLYGSGEQCRDFTYVDDIVDATVTASSSTIPGVFNVGAGRATSVHEVLRIAEGLTGRRVPVNQDAARNGDVLATLADSTLAHDTLEWWPQVDLTTGMRRHLDWLRWNHRPRWLTA